MTSSERRRSRPQCLGSISASTLDARHGAVGALQPVRAAHDGSATHIEKTGNRAMPRDRAYWLSEFVLKIRVQCECGLKKQYDAKALLDRIGDECMPSLLPRIARANGCTKTENKVRDRCRLHYADRHPAEQPLSRQTRPARVRRRPGNPRRSPSPICRSGTSFSATASDAVARGSSIAKHWQAASGCRNRSWRWRGGCDVESAAT